MFGQDFYPTPSNLISQMLNKINFDGVQHVLEPSAGRGDIIERLKSYHSSRHHTKLDIDAVEVDAELSAVLVSKGFKPIASDFLTMHTFKRYDAIIMNPPFSDGDKHLLKAIDLQKDGGQIVALLNAETIKNPYTNTRKHLTDKIEQLGGTVEYLDGSFTSAARTTNVETALIYLNIPAREQSDILRNLVEARELEEGRDEQASEVVEGDYIAGAVRRYEIETAAGLKLINEYLALKPLLSRSFDGQYSMLELKVDGNDYGDLRNAFVAKVRSKYWRELFQSNQFANIFTDKVRDNYRQKIDELQSYEFTLTNIKQIQIDVSASMLSTLDDAIVGLFDEFSSQYWDEASRNIHYYNGWKTNKAYIVNKKVVTRLNAFGGSLWSSNGPYHPASYDVSNKLADIGKVFAYLDGKLMSDNSELDAALQIAKQAEQTRDVDLGYFKATFYKKGTAHITFTDDRLLKKFNLIGSLRKGWLPPTYGSKSYEAMTVQEREVVEAFEGEESYRDTVAQRAFYDSRPALQLTDGK